MTTSTEQQSETARLATLAKRSRTARQALRDAVAASRLRESEIVAATGLARMTVRSWRQSADG